MSFVLEKNKSSNTNDILGQVNVGSAIVKLGIPSIACMLVIWTNSLIDTYVASTLGDSQTAAVGVVFSVLSFVQAIGYTYGMGAGSSISRELGKDEDKQASVMVSVGLIGAFVTGLVLAVLGNVFVEELCSLIGASKSALPYAVSYGRYVLFATPVMCGQFVLNNALRAEGRPWAAFFGIAGGGVVGIALDFVLVFIFDMDVKGIGIATLICQIVTLIILYWLLQLGKKGVRIRLSYMFKGAKYYFKVIKMGAASFVRQGFCAIAVLITNRLARDYGDNVVAALSIASKLFGLVFAALVGYGQGYAPVAGYAYGERDEKRLKKATKFAMISATVVMIILGAVLYFAADNVVGLFEGKEDTLKLATFAFRFQCVSFGFVAVGIIYGIYLQSVGKYGVATLVSALRQGLVFVPIIFILDRVFNQKGLAASQAIADIITGTIVIACIWRSLSAKRL